MTAQKLDGTATLKAIKAELAERVAALRERGVTPGLGTVLVGDDPGSHWYVAAKHKDCAEIGIESIRRDLPATATQAEVEAVIDELNADPSCTGFLVQQPTGLDEFALLSRVDPDKDVDGLHPVNLGKLVLGEPGSLPCTPIGCIELLRRHGVADRGRRGDRARPRPHRRPSAGAAAHPQVRERHGHPLPHPHPRPGRAHPHRRHRRRRRRRARHHHRRHGQARCRRARRRRLPGRRQDRRRRGRRRLGRRGLGLAEPRRRRPDDPRDAAHATSC